MTLGIARMFLSFYNFVLNSMGYFTLSFIITFVTRMHSSRMRTARLLPVSPSMHCSGGVPDRGGYLPRGDVPAWGECTPPEI